MEAPPVAASLSAWDAWGGDAQGRRYAPVDQMWKIRSSTFPGTSRLAQKGFNEHGPKPDQR